MDMYKKWLFLFTGLSALLGALLWIRFGSELALMPPGIPGKSYRSSNLLMPWFGAGMVSVAIGLGGMYASLQGNKRMARWAMAAALAGSGLYLYGTLARLSLNGGWEPAQPVGFLMAAIGSFMLSVSVLRSRSLPRWCGITLLFSTVCMLSFNDQFVTAWASVPLGAAWIVLSFFLVNQFFRVNAQGRAVG